MAKTDYEQLRENIFLPMCGELDVESYGIENEFAAVKDCECLKILQFSRESQPACNHKFYSLMVL